MARFDVYRERDSDNLVLDCQADVLGTLRTRFVVPLLSQENGPPPIQRLNPAFDLSGVKLVLYPQFAASVPVSEITGPIGSLASEHPRIMNALDMLISGY